MASEIQGNSSIVDSRRRTVRVPFISTSFVQNLWYYALLWPVWWALGIEQLLLPFFLLFEFVRFLVNARWRFQLNTSSLFAVLLALWWVIPIFWLDRDFLDIFLKETATIYSQALILILLWNCIKTIDDWRTVSRTLMVMAVYTSLAGVIFLSGLWQGSFLSFFGRLLPPSLVEGSAFFTSIAIRQFGSAAEDGGLLPFRLMSFSLSFSSLSMICLLLIPYVMWHIQMPRNSKRWFFIGIFFALVLCLIFTESRISYVAFVFGFLLYFILRMNLLRGMNLPLTIAIGLAATGLAIATGYILMEFLLRTIELTFIDLRPSSWLVRLNIYIVTLRLLPDHMIAGWGVPVRIPGASSVYSAGTHSSYLGMLFQHGIVGLFLYLALWFSIWRVTIQGLQNRAISAISTKFWISAAVAFFAFNIREVADSWWWDQSLLFVIWLLWGLVITAPKFINNTEPAHE